MKKKKLLFLTSRFPYPLEKGDKLRAYHFIRQLSRHFDIHLYSLNTTEPDKAQIDALAPFCVRIKTGILSKSNSILSLFRPGNRPFQVSYFYSKTIHRNIEEFAGEAEPDVIFCHLIRMSEYAKTLRAPVKVLDYMDAFSKGMEKLQKNGGLLTRPFAGLERKRLLKYEFDIFTRFDRHFIISEQDRSHIPHPENNCIEVVANGVDFDYFKPITSAKKYDLLFNGHMSYPPNIASAVFTAEEVLPLLKKKFPDIHFLIAGAAPIRKIRALSGPNITVTGWLEDIRISFAESRVMIAPMLISIGLQNKILQAMAMKIPCVISPMANKALGARHEIELFVAETPAEYEHYCERLLQDEKLRTRMSEAAFTFVKSKFSWEVNCDKMSDSIQELLIAEERNPKIS